MSLGSLTVTFKDKTEKTFPCDAYIQASNGLLTIQGFQQINGYVNPLVLVTLQVYQPGTYVTATYVANPASQLSPQQFQKLAARTDIAIKQNGTGAPLADPVLFAKNARPQGKA